MIELVDAHFRNFRLLRDVRLEFARSAESPVTVIRAENGTGKTTLLTALTWGLFGDDALPTRRSRYRLHPIDWDITTDGGECRISAEITFVTTDDETGEQTEYRLIRTSTESVGEDGDHTPTMTSLTLLRTTPTGHKEVDNPTAFIANRVLPLSLKDVFFIDGDRALAFIEAADDRSAKRDRVEAAVRQLLGLDLLESAERHVDEARRIGMRTARTAAVGTSMEQAARRRDELEAKKEKLKDERSDLEADRIASQSRLIRAKETLREVLTAGGGEREDLVRQFNAAETRLKSQRSQRPDLVRQLRNALSDTDLAYALAGPAVGKASKLLRDLEAQHIIPNTLPEVVKERLERGTCICGADVSDGTPAHAVLCDLLEESKKLTSHHEVLMHLNIAAGRRTMAVEDTNIKWSERLRAFQKALGLNKQHVEEAEREVGELRARIAAIPERDVKTAENLVTQEESELQRLTSDIGKIDGRLRETDDELKRVTVEVTEHSKKQKKLLRGLADETAAQDLLNVIKGTIETLEGETLVEVSNEMNRVFLKMIVEDAESDGIIRGAELTPDHDIVVRGPGTQLLDPDRDLSGAQRRALTLAFILALVAVSGVSAPNVVDTPLGMTSGPVRRAILRHSAEMATQLVLFLTHSEIVGVEDILDSVTGRTYTLTNSDHYPERVKNMPPTDKLETLVCDCDYYSHCSICERTAVA